MTYYKCKREIWTPSPIDNFPEVLSFKKGNLYFVENQETLDEEGQIFSFREKDDVWFERHFEPI